MKIGMNFIYTIGLFQSLCSLRVYASITNTNSCDCHSVSNWQEFQQTILDANQNTSMGGLVNVIFCPFSIDKVHDSTTTTNFWALNVPITRPMMIACQKDHPNDSCEINIIGPSCGLDENCGRFIFSIKSDHVYLDGFIIRNAQDNIIHIARNRKNIKLVHMKIFGGKLPPVSDTETNHPNERGLIVVRENASVQIISSLMSWNSATVLYNLGDTLIHSSGMKNNKKSRMDSSKMGAIYNKGTLTITQSEWINNTAAVGPGIYHDGYEYHGNIYDGGMNCSSGQSCNGIEVGLAGMNGLNHDVHQCIAFQSDGSVVC